MDCERTWTCHYKTTCEITTTSCVHNTNTTHQHQHHTRSSWTATEWIGSMQQNILFKLIIAVYCLQLTWLDMLICLCASQTTGHASTRNAEPLTQVGHLCCVCVCTCMAASCTYLFLLLSIILFSLYVCCHVCVIGVIDTAFGDMDSISVDPSPSSRVAAAQAYVSAGSTSPKELELFSCFRSSQGAANTTTTTSTTPTSPDYQVVP